MESKTMMFWDLFTSISFSKIVVRVPRNVEEQSRIARFLLELDELISCTEQEIEITKRMKKGCLQKMFV